MIFFFSLHNIIFTLNSHHNGCFLDTCYLKTAEYSKLLKIILKNKKSSTKNYRKFTYEENNFTLWSNDSQHFLIQIQGNVDGVRLALVQRSK